MGVLAERLAQLRVRVTSPDRRITAELHDESEVDLSFVAGAYRRYTEPALEGQLRAIAARLWNARMERYYAALSEALGQPVTGEPRPTGEPNIGFHAARDELHAAGASADGRIRLSVCGMREWRVRINTGTVRVLNERQFTDGVREAARELIHDQCARLRQLQWRVYGDIGR